MKCDELCVYKDCEDFQTFDRHFTEAYKKSGGKKPPKK